MIFILGGNGFVGSAFARLCRATGQEHVVLARDNYAAHRGRACSVRCSPVWPCSCHCDGGGDGEQPSDGSSRTRPVTQFHYHHTSSFIMNVLRFSATATILLLGGFLVVMLRRERNPMADRTRRNPGRRS